MKRYAFRTAALLSLVAVLAVGGSRIANRYLARGLAERAAGSAGASRRLLSEMERAGLEALDPLADAAANPDRPAAQAARRQIRRLLNRWRQLEAEDGAERTQRKRLALARALLKRADRFSPSGQQWLATVADRLLQDGAPGAGAAELVAVCDELLASSRRRAAILDRIAAQPTALRTPLPEPAEPPQLLSGAAGPPNELQPTATPDVSETPPTAWRQPQTPTAQGPPSPAPLDSPLGETVAASPTAPVPLRQPSRLAWQSPGSTESGIAGPPGIHRRPRAAADLLSGPTLGYAVLSAMPDRLLLALGATENAAVSAVIANRGFADATPLQLALAVSPEERSRLRLVNDLFRAPSRSTARLLLLLASDESPRVRAAAIESLGASGQAALVDAAWRLAVQDRDPRVARLANQLRRQ